MMTRGQIRNHSILALVRAAALAANAAVSKPNIIIILTDDHGYTDLGIHGIDANVQTPAMDTLAASGALFTHGYATAPQCKPSRAGLMTGRYQNRFGLRDNGDGFMPLSETVVAQRMRTNGYVTGMIGKWHLDPNNTTNFPGAASDYYPGARGFDDYWFASVSPYLANFNLAGATIPEQNISDSRNRVLVQGLAAKAFIDRHTNSPFFLYVALFGPHIPRIGKNDSYYLNFPVVDYPNYSSDLDDVRRQGLALIKAADDAVDGIMQKLRQYGMETNTLIFFAGDNGAQPKFFAEIGGAETVSSWDGSENLPRRGEKGSLWEGGINVPMWAYWKGRIPGGQVIHDPAITLDFTATAVKLASGAIPAGFDGVDLLPRLTNGAPQIVRAAPLFWDWGTEIAIRKGDWKMRRNGSGDYLFNLVNDPNELTNLVFQLPAKQVELGSDLDAWEASLPAAGRAHIGGGVDLYTTGAPVGTAVDPRYLSPSQPYPAAIVTPGAVVDSDGDGMLNADELSAGRDPYHAADLGFEFNSTGDYQGWVPVNYLNYSAVTNGVLAGQALSSQGKFEHYDFKFAAAQVDRLLVRLKSPVGSSLTFRWARVGADAFAQERTVSVSYLPGANFQTVVIPLKGHAEWDGQTITQLRLNPVNTLADFQVDWIRADWDGDRDGDGMADKAEVGAGRNPASTADLAFHFNTNGVFEGWNTNTSGISGLAVTNGVLIGTATNSNPYVENHAFNYDSSAISAVTVRLRAATNGNVQLHWASVGGVISPALHVDQTYTSNGDWQVLEFVLGGDDDYDNSQITKLRLVPTTTVGAWFQVDWIRAVNGDADNDGFPDWAENIAGTDRLNPVENKFKISSATVPVTVAGKAGRIYSLERTGSLAPAAWSSVETVGPLVADQTVVFTNGTPSVSGFYRVKVALP